MTPKSELERVVEVKEQFAQQTSLVFNGLESKMQHFNNFIRFIFLSLIAKKLYSCRAEGPPNEHSNELKKLCPLLLFQWNYSSVTSKTNQNIFLDFSVIIQSYSSIFE